MRRSSIAIYYEAFSAPLIGFGIAAERQVMASFAALPGEQRSVLFLVGVEDLSYEQAARVLGVPIGTVMSRLCRGRERLRQLMYRDLEAPSPVSGRVK
ncbi:MAG: sigma factor-like helix-turn-helix DNA-binding protein [Stellaceae bacterium]